MPSMKPMWARAGRGDGVADRPHAGLAGAADVVDLDEAALVDLHRGAVEAEVVGVRLAADRHHHDVDVEGLAAGLHGGAAAGGRVALDLHVGADVDAAALERGSLIAAVDLSSTSTVRQAFSQQALGMPIEAVRYHWMREGGRWETAALSKGSDEEVIAFVAARRGAVATSRSAPGAGELREVTLR